MKELTHATIDYLLYLISQTSLQNKSFKDTVAGLSKVKDLKEVPGDRVSAFFEYQNPHATASAKYTLCVEADGSCTIDVSGNPVKFDIQYFSKHRVRNSEARHKPTSDLEYTFLGARNYGLGIDSVAEELETLGLTRTEFHRRAAKLIGDFSIVGYQAEPGIPSGIIVDLRETANSVHPTYGDWTLEMKMHVRPVFEKPKPSKSRRVDYTAYAPVFGFGPKPRTASNPATP